MLCENGPRAQNDMFYGYGGLGGGLSEKGRVGGIGGMKTMCYRMLLWCYHVLDALNKVGAHGKCSKRAHQVESEAREYFHP